MICMGNGQNPPVQNPPYIYNEALYSGRNVGNMSRHATKQHYSAAPKQKSFE